jgi:hypothetical protein
MHPFVVRNTLISPKAIEDCLALPRNEAGVTALSDVLSRFQEMKGFASEIHTETNLIRPILKLLGYAYESKPKFFEARAKGPDAALFSSEEEMTGGAAFWGTEQYFQRALGLLVLKRYGRTLTEGVSGFYLDFENRIPLYQILYLLKRTRTPWGILTNGKNWLLIARPSWFETRLIELDLETFFATRDDTVFHLFLELFSNRGIGSTLPLLMEADRVALARLLQTTKRSLHQALRETERPVEIYPRLVDAYHRFFPANRLPSVTELLGEQQVDVPPAPHEKPDVVTDWNETGICSYLFLREDPAPGLDLTGIVTGDGPFFKEDLFSLRILDMTPGFGAVPVALVENLSYLSFTLPYRDRTTFVTEWENEQRLKRHIVQTILFGIERSRFAFDVLRNVMRKLYGVEALNYRLGNPLIGMPLKGITKGFDDQNQMGLFTRHPQELLDEFYALHRQYASLSPKIKEDALLREEIGVTLKRYTERIRDILDMMTAQFFHKKVDAKKVQDLLANLSADEAMWTMVRRRDWFVESKQIARRTGFFHPEIEFPFLLRDGFDLIFVQPAMAYFWEEAYPPGEMIKAYIKRATTYLKEQGKLVLIPDAATRETLQGLVRSKRFSIQERGDLVIVRRRETAR